MAAVNIEMQGISPFECKGNSSALAPRWKKWFQAFQYFLVAKGVVNDAQKKALLPHTAGLEAHELYETLMAQAKIRLRRIPQRNTRKLFAL